MTDEHEFVARRNVDDGVCTLSIIRDPADAQQLHHAVVTRADDGSLVGLYYPSDICRQTGWTVVTADAETYHVDRESAAVWALATLAHRP